MDIVKGGAREERPPVSSAEMPGLEKGLTAFLGKVVGEEGIFEGVKWECKDGMCLLGCDWFRKRGC